MHTKCTPHTAHHTDMPVPYMSDLHAAARAGSVRRTLDALVVDHADDRVNIDEGYDEEGWTPLMLAAEEGYVRVVNTLLKYGANVSAKTVSGHTALHLAISHKHISVTKALIRAGADLTATAIRYTQGAKVVQHTGFTPLHLAAREGFCEGILALLRAGVSVQPRLGNGSTPLFAAAYHGHLSAIQVLLRAGANPLLPAGSNTPLDAAARKGHLNVVRELVRQFYIDGCALDGGENALTLSASSDHFEMLTFLLNWGAVDMTGEALSLAVENGSKSCLQLLLCRCGGHASGSVKKYVNIARGYDNPLLYSFNLGRGMAPRFAKLLIEARVDTASNVVFEDDGEAMGTGTPLAIAKLVMKDKGLDHSVKDGVKGVIRVLRQRNAINASSWAWPRNKKKIARSTAATPTRVPHQSSKMIWVAMMRYVVEYYEIRPFTLFT